MVRRDTQQASCGRCSAGQHNAPPPVPPLPSHRYVLVQGDYAGRVQGVVYSLQDPDHPQQLALEVLGADVSMAPPCASLAGAL